MSAVRWIAGPPRRTVVPPINDDVLFTQRNLRLVSSVPTAPRPLFGAGSRYPYPDDTPNDFGDSTIEPGFGEGLWLLLFIGTLGLIGTAVVVAQIVRLFR